MGARLHGLVKPLTLLANLVCPVKVCDSKWTLPQRILDFQTRLCWASWRFSLAIQRANELGGLNTTASQRRNRKYKETQFAHSRAGGATIKYKKKWTIRRVAFWSLMRMGSFATPISSNSGRQHWRTVIWLIATRADNGFLHSKQNYVVDVMGRS